MAVSKVDVHIQNPAGKGKMATKRKKHKMSPKQIRIFGTKRQKAALKAKRRHAPAKKRTNSAPRRKVHSKKRSSHRPRTKRQNPVAEIISWTAGNPARKGKRKMARSKRKKSSARHRNAGRSHSKKKMTSRRHRRSNPGFLGKPMDWAAGGAGVLAGVVGTRALPQMVLGAGNTGAMGYAANAVTALGLGWLTHMVFPRNPVLTGAVIAGGFAATIARVISDRTPFGAQLSLTGLGDWGLGLYQKSNFNNPQRIVAPRGPNSSMFTWGAGDQGVPSMASAGSDSTSAC
jgi:hypothetical protein